MAVRFRGDQGSAYRVAQKVIPSRTV